MFLTNFLKLTIFIILLFASFDKTEAQQSEISKRVFRLTEIITSRMDSSAFDTDLNSIDSVFNQAVTLCDGNYQEALLALTFSYLPYNEVPLHSPVFKVKVSIPLYSAPEDIFLVKNEKIPRYFLFDSPRTPHGDQDKLAHFFGSALLSYSLKNYYVCMFIGYFVEFFEAVFKVDGAADFRDLTTNRLGIAFGRYLSQDNKTKPSQIFRSYNTFQILQ